MVSKFYFIKVWLCQNQNFYHIVIQSEAKNLKASTEYTTNALQILPPYGRLDDKQKTINLLTI